MSGDKNTFAGIAFKANSTTPNQEKNSIGASIRAVRNYGKEPYLKPMDESTDLIFSTNAQSEDDLRDRMIISHKGDVGIGTYPDAHLTVYHDFNMKSGFKVNGQTPEKLFIGPNNFGDFYMELNDKNADTKIKFNTSGPSYFNGGNLGIGTNNPSTNLEVSGKTKTINLMMTNGATKRLCDAIGWKWKCQLGRSRYF